MNLTKKLAKDILKEAVRLDKLDDKEQKLYDDLFDFISPDSYPPIINSQRVSSFVRGLDMVFPDIQEDISYFVYEVPNMNSDEVICETADGKKYDAKKLNEFAQFMVDARK